MKEAMFYSRLPRKAVRCSLCPRECVITPGKTGFCGVRQNLGGTLQSLSYGRLCSMGVDPIEKKPLYHFAPGSSCLSVCTVGCNLDCQFCQNWSISHIERNKGGELPGEDVPPREIVRYAIERGVQGIACTYTEPTVFFEYALETMKLARKAGLYNVWVSNGYTNPEPAMQASRYLDAINLDIKGPDSLYRKLCNAPGDSPVKRAAMLYREQGIWVETTTLVIPGHNDSDKDLTAISRWVRRNLGPDTPVHFSRFHPHFRLTHVEPTPLETLERAHRIAVKEGLNHVYIGNVPGHREESTHCPECGATLIERTGYGVGSVKGRCQCGYRLPLGRPSTAN